MDTAVHRKIAFAIVLSAVLVPFAANPHPGGLDSAGCHRNRKTGDYHCHRSDTPPPAIGA